MTRGYENIKKMVNEATTEILLEMFNAISLNEDSDIETTLVWTAVTSELEDRNAIVSFVKFQFVGQFTATPP